MIAQGAGSCKVVNVGTALLPPGSGLTGARLSSSVALMPRLPCYDTILWSRNADLPAFPWWRAQGAGGELRALLAGASSDTDLRQSKLQGRQRNCTSGGIITSMRQVLLMASDA